MSKDQQPTANKVQDVENDAQTAPQRHLCVLCKEEMLEGASVCRRCHRHQNWWVRHLPNATVITSIGLLVLTYLQFDAASDERVKAQKALDDATAALEKAKETEDKFLGLSQKATAIENNLVSYSKKLTSNIRSANLHSSLSSRLNDEYIKITHINSSISFTKIFKQSLYPEANTVSLYSSEDLKLMKSKAFSAYDDPYTITDVVPQQDPSFLTMNWETIQRWIFGKNYFLWSDFTVGTMSSDFSKTKSITLCSKAQSRTLQQNFSFCCQNEKNFKRTFWT